MSNMSYVLVFCVASTFLQALALKEQGVTIQNEVDLHLEEKSCINELNLEESYIKELKRLNTLPWDNSQYNDFLNCYWKKLEWIEDDNDINYDKIKTSVPQKMTSRLSSLSDEERETTLDLIWSAVDYCKVNPSTKGKNPVEKIFILKDCVKKITEL